MIWTSKPWCLVYQRGPLSIICLGFGRRTTWVNKQPPVTPADLNRECQATIAVTILVASSLVSRTLAPVRVLRPGCGRQVIDVKVSARWSETESCFSIIAESEFDRLPVQDVGGAGDPRSRPTGSRNTQISRKLRSLCECCGCVSLRSASASICRIRSRVNENWFPTSSKV